MKSKEEIEQLAKQFCNIPIDLVIDEKERYYKNFQKYDGIIQGYTQCQEDMADKWISVKEDLPKEKSLGQSDFVLTFNGDCISTNLYDYELKRWASVLRDSITHWMPLPNKPLNKQD